MSGTTRAQHGTSNNNTNIPDISDLTKNVPVSHATLKFAASLANVQHKPVKKLIRAKNTTTHTSNTSTHHTPNSITHNNTHINPTVSRQVSLVKAVNNSGSMKSQRVSIGSSAELHALTTQLHTLQNQLNDERQASKSINEQMKKLKVENVRLKQNLHASLKPSAVPIVPGRRVSEHSNAGSSHSTGTNTHADIENRHNGKKLLLQQQHERSQTLRYPLQPAPINTMSHTVTSNNPVTQQLSRHNAINARLKAQQKQFQTLPPMSSSGVNRPNTAYIFGGTGKSTGGSPVSSTSRQQHHITESNDSSPKLDSAKHSEVILLKQQLIEQSRQFELQFNTAQTEWSQRVEQLQDLVLTYQEKQDMNAKTVTDLLAQLHQSKIDYNLLNDKLQSAEQSNVALTAMNNALTESVKQLQHKQTNDTDSNDQLSATKSRWQQKQQKNIHASCIEEIENLKFQLYYGRQIDANLSRTQLTDQQRKSTVPAYAPMFVDILENANNDADTITSTNVELIS